MRREPETHPNGYWMGEGVQEFHYFDRSLADELVFFFEREKVKIVADFGCGMGDYVKFLNEHRITCEGFDGHPDTEKITGGFASVIDLSETFNLGRKFDWVLSLEVGEHIPKSSENAFIENIVRHAKNGIILSWAIPGQGGHGHLNEQTNESIKMTMSRYGYSNDLQSERLFRLVSHLPWLQNTLMVFRKNFRPLRN